MTNVKKAELRVAVAKDVLKSLKLSEMEASRGSFVQSKFDVRNMIVDNDSKKTAQELKKVCNVCALGACLLSTVALTNEFNFDERLYSSGIIDLSGPVVFKRLNQIFPKEQLYLIENAFEFGNGWLSNFDPNDSSGAGTFLTDRSGITFKQAMKLEPERQRAVRFGLKYPDWNEANERLAAIMRNIVRNKGTFKP